MSLMEGRRVGSARTDARIRSSSFARRVALPLGESEPPRARALARARAAARGSLSFASPFPSVGSGRLTLGTTGGSGGGESGFAAVFAFLSFLSDFASTAVAASGDRGPKQEKQ